MTSHVTKLLTNFMNENKNKFDNELLIDYKQLMSNINGELNNVSNKTLIKLRLKIICAICDDRINDDTCIKCLRCGNPLCWHCFKKIGVSKCPYCRSETDLMVFDKEKNDYNEPMEAFKGDIVSLFRYTKHAKKINVLLKNADDDDVVDFRMLPITDKEYNEYRVCDSVNRVQKFYIEGVIFIVAYNGSSAFALELLNFID